MKKDISKIVSAALSVTGCTALAAVFLHWTLAKSNHTAWGFSAASASVLLAAWVYLKFVPVWVNFWQKDKISDVSDIKTEKSPKYIYLKIAAAFIGISAATLAIVFLIRYSKGYCTSFADSLRVWLETDALHYQDIAKEWYLSEGIWDRLVQLVFLPGYPIIVRIVSLAVKDCYYAAFAVSVCCFAASGCMMYKVMRLDYSHKEAIKAVKYLGIIPASFFFSGPVSESLFLLLCLCCIYFIRTKRWLLGSIAGGYAAFTRSLGITLIIVLVMEFVKESINSQKSELKSARTVKNGLSMLLVPAGFGVYCCINYFVSGNFFKFMEYQSKHWSQNLGWFFNTANYQTELVVSNWGKNFKIIAGLWFPNVFMIFAALAVMLLAVKKLRASYTAWFIGYFIVAIGATWLLSAPRYLAAFAPISMAAALITDKKKADCIITVCCIMLNLAYLYVFSVRWYVW